MSELSRKIKKCLQSDDVESLKTIILESGTDLLTIKSIIEEYGKAYLLEEVDGWFGDNKIKKGLYERKAKKLKKESLGVSKPHLKDDVRIQNEGRGVLQLDGQDSSDVVFRLKCNNRVETLRCQSEMGELTIGEYGKNTDAGEALVESDQIITSEIVSKSDLVKNDSAIEIESCSIKSVKMGNRVQDRKEEQGKDMHDETKSSTQPYKLITADPESMELPIKEDTHQKLPKEEIKLILTEFLTKDTASDRLITAFYDAMCSNTSYYNYKAIASISRELVFEMVKLEKHKDGEFLRSKILNLKNLANPELCDSVVRGNISPIKYLAMTNDEMKSKKLKLAEEKIVQESIMDMQVKKVEAETDMFRCSRCKNRKTTYSQLQTRSADEPMTTFVTCAVCNHRWKF